MTGCGTLTKQSSVRKLQAMPCIWKKLDPFGIDLTCPVVPQEIMTVSKFHFDTDLPVCKCAEVYTQITNLLTAFHHQVQDLARHKVDQ